MSEIYSRLGPPLSSDLVQRKLQEGEPANARDWSPTRIMLGVVLAAAVALITTSGSVTAQDGDGMGLSDTQTTRVTEIMGPGLKTCAEVEVVYRPDCFQQVYRAAARQLGRNWYWYSRLAVTSLSPPTVSTRVSPSGCSTSISLPMAW